MPKKRKLSRVPGQRSLPPVAPYESCIACFRGDTRTSVQLRHGATG